MQILKRHPDIAALTTLLLLTILFFVPYLNASTLIFPNSDLGTDFTRETWPMSHYVRSSIDQTGHLPLWRTYDLSGTALVGHPVAPLFYPIHWLILILPVSLALNIDIVLHLWWAGAGLYACLRLLRGIRPEAALIGALLFAHAPRIIAHVAGGHFPMIAAISWWGWAWLGLHCLFTTRKPIWAVLLGVAMAAQALNDGRYLLISSLCLLPPTLWYLYRNRQYRLTLVGALTAVSITIGLAAVQLIPLIDVINFSPRTSLNFETAGEGLPVPLLVSLVLPFYIKMPELIVFGGVALILLIMYGLATGWHIQERLWAVGIILLIILNLGSATPLYSILYNIVPGFSLLRYPNRFFLIALFGLATLAAYGVEQYLNRMRPARWFRIFLIVFSAIYAVSWGLAIVGILRFDIFPHVLILPLIGFLLLRPQAFYPLLLLFCVVEIWWFNANLVRPQPESELTALSPLGSFIQANLRLDERILAPYGLPNELEFFNAGIPSADGYDPVHHAIYGDFMRRAVGCDFTGYSVGVPPTRASAEAARVCPVFTPALNLLALVNVRYVVLPMMYGEDTPVFSDNGYHVYELSDGIGRAIGIGRWRSVSGEQCLSELSELDVFNEALVESAPPAGVSAAPLEVIGHSRNPNDEAFSVNGGGLLVRSEAWTSQWQASVDGQPVEVIRVNCVLQGVWLSDGVHEIRFYYEPRGYVVGRWLTLFTILLLGAAGLFGFVYRVNHAPTAE